MIVVGYAAQVYDRGKNSPLTPSEDACTAVSWCSLSIMTIASSLHAQRNCRAGQETVASITNAGSSRTFAMRNNLKSLKERCRSDAFYNLSF